MEHGMTKEHTKMLYGLAILLMLYHHLFCIPARLHIDYFSVLGGAETKIAWFCKICVAVYAFISGYGISRSFEKSYSGDLIRNLKVNYQYIFLHTINFMKKYWIVYLLFIPAGIAFKLVKSDAIHFVAGIFGFGYPYNGEWWYVVQYICMLLMAPLLNGIVEKSGGQDRSIKTCIIGVFVLYTLITIYLRKLIPIQLSMYFVFIIAFIVARLQIFERITKEKNNRVITISAVMLLGICIAVRACTANSASYNRIDMIIISPFIFSICIIVEKLHYLYKALQKLGKYSVYMWLTHTFYCYYYFQNIIVVSKISTIIYIELLIVSLITAMILINIERYIEKGLREWARLRLQKMK